MRAKNRLSKDNYGVSIPLEYVFVIIITATFFAMFLLLVNATIRNTDQTVVGQELGIVANDVANRISESSSKISLYRSNNIEWASNISTYSEAIDLPDLAQGKQYSVSITYDDISKTGKVTVFYGLNANINRTVSFSSATKVVNAKIASTDSSPRISYYPDNQTIMVVGF